MRHLLSAILTVLSMSAAFLVLSNNKCDSKSNIPIDSECKSNSDNDVPRHHYGDTLYQWDGKTIIYDILAADDEEVSSLSKSAMITYADTVPFDTCWVLGTGMYYADEPTVKFAIGGDTICYDIRHLPDSVNHVEEMLPSDIVKHKYSYQFTLTKLSWECGFRMLAYLPENHPAWLNTFLATILHDDIQAIYLVNKGADRIIKDYYGIEAQPKKIGVINAAKMATEEIARHFALVDEKLYRKEFPVEEYNGHGPRYDYMLEMLPAWTSPDSFYVTYRFYSYYNTMGAHGFMEEYYLTFNNKTGKLLGYKDIFGATAFEEAITLLEEKLTSYKEEIFETKLEKPYLAGMNAGSLSSNAAEIIKEWYERVYYPRPAMTNERVVFSYQPYEKGGFWESIIHFVIPYARLRTKCFQAQTRWCYGI